MNTGTLRKSFKFCNSKLLRIVECCGGRYLSYRVVSSKISLRKLSNSPDAFCLSSNLKSYLSITSSNGDGVSIAGRYCQFSTRPEEQEKTAAPPLNRQNAHALVMRLTTDERTALMTVLREFESEDLKAEYKGQLAAFRWRSKFGRPSKMPRLGDVDPTGSYCPVPEDWLLRKYAESVPKPTSGQLVGVAVHNATPFIGFGFLDNFFMIICGDYIEMYVGSIITISTMAAAALGNTLSDVLGIGSAFYVEWAVSKFGFKPPNLSPIQLDMNSSRLASNLGRVLGVTIGCLLGMFPLLLIHKKKDDDSKKKKEKKEEE